MSRPAVIALAADLLEELLQEHEDADGTASLLHAWLTMVPGASADELRAALRIMREREALLLAVSERQGATLH